MKELTVSVCDHAGNMPKCENFSKICFDDIGFKHYLKVCRHVKWDPALLVHICEYKPAPIGIEKWREELQHKGAK